MLILILGSSLFFPQPTSYIDGIKIWANFDTSVKYPFAYPSLTLTGVRTGSEIDVIRLSDGVILYEGVYSGADQGTFSWVYEYYSDVAVNICILNNNYAYWNLQTTLGSTGVSIPVQQILDRVYAS